MSPPPIILASSSPYRRALLARLQLTFQIVAPDVDETPLPQETPLATAQRLALAKAHRVATLYTDALVIGSDQVCVLDGRTLGKPGNHQNAVAQLQILRGKEAKFHTALCLLNVRTQRYQQAVDTTSVRFRMLDDAQIENYLRRDQAYDSAGSAKAESLGIALVECITSDDPTGIIGLPLIQLVSMLTQEGIAVV